MHTVLVCGGRGYKDRETVYWHLDAHHKRRPINLLVHGGATGADTLAGDWAYERGVPFNCYPADWKTHGRAAGPIRNQQMLDEARPDLVIAFPGTNGTRDMKWRAAKAGIEVIDYA